MRVIPDALAAKLAGGVTTLAHLWRVQRRDGEVFGFTDHDGDLTVAGVTYQAQAGLMAGAIEKSAGLSIDTASAQGALTAACITAEDLARGLWDGARVDIWRADWTAPAQRVHLFAGRLGEVRRGETTFAAELRGLQAALNAPVGRVFSRFCDADVGDARCGVDLSDVRWRGIGAVSAAIDHATFTATGLAAFADGLFARGMLTWDDGGAVEVTAHHAGGLATIELSAPSATPILPGASFVITAGCDKRLATCRDRFENVANHRGFPHMPGNDAVQSGPSQRATLDGGSRWTDQ
jgi:uncharacterized phage protein (TIGR02218 family)